MSLGGLATKSFKHNMTGVYQTLYTTLVLKVLPAIRVWTFLLCMTLSFTIGVWWCRYFVPQTNDGRPICEQVQQQMAARRPRLLQEEIKTRELLFIGIMTSQKFLATRAKGVYDTWGRNVPGRLVFFAGMGEKIPKINLPVVYLPVPDNIHPPQKKSLAMLKYIYEHFIDDFQWFIRADDDVYMRTRKLAVFLRKINSSETLLLGQAGVGKREERGKLGLRDGDNFCMGGPGVIMSRGVLEKVSGHLEYCSNNTATFHEDTEVGRCLRNFAGVMCPWAYEHRELFHQVYENQAEAYHDSLATSVIDNAITLHPIKDPAHMRRIHVHYLNKETQTLDHKTSLLQHKLRLLKQASEGEVSLKTTFSRKDDDIHHNVTVSWETFKSRQIFSLFEKAPLRWIHDSVRDGLIRVVWKAKRMVKEQGVSKRYHSFRFTNDILGYLNHHPVSGSQYIIRLSSVNFIRKNQKDNPKRSISAHWFKFQKSFRPLRYRTITNNPNIETVHFVVPLAGRLGNFRRFLASFENAFLRHDKKVKLLVVYFPKLKVLKDSGKHQKVLRMYKMKYPLGVFHWLNVNTSTFQRGLALNLGSKYFGKDALLSFTDVDLVFQTEYLYRCRSNTVRREQVYFPIMFSQFHPNITGTHEKQVFTNPFTIHKDAGLWRVYSYGPVCVYSNDVNTVGGFNTTIKGWGLEDVDFFEKFVKSGKMKVMRSPDRGLVHVFHKHARCSPRSTFQQQKMCRDAIAAYMSSSSLALGYLTRKHYLKFIE